MVNSSHARLSGVATTDCVSAMQVIGGEKNSLQKVINVNEARGIGQMSPDSLLLGGVWGRD